MSLFSRIIGLTEPKIPIHAIQSMVSEIECGRLAMSDIISEYDLTTAEQQDLSNFLGYISVSSNKLRMSARIFNYLCLGEMGMTKYRDYTDEALFWQMMIDESSRP